MQMMAAFELMSVDRILRQDSADVNAVCAAGIYGSYRCATTYVILQSLCQAS